VKPRNASPAVATNATSTTPESTTTSPPAGNQGKALNHCVWCGEVLPGNRALFHNCGAKDRPAAFCRNCGDALIDGTFNCANCGSSSDS
jgi:hypothetical protein